jgi:hypothetical protein
VRPLMNLLQLLNIVNFIRKLLGSKVPISQPIHPLQMHEILE